MNARGLVAAVLTAMAIVMTSTPSFGQAAGPSVPVQGQVLSRNINGPVPGLTVFLVHEFLGRSAPSYTDAYGRFGWTAIPVRSEPYFLEIYWGQNLVYRQPVAVTAPVSLPAIQL